MATCYKMTDEEKALAEKNLGHKAHKKKDYDVALFHYSKAMRLNPKEMTYIFHTARIHFEQKNYVESIKFCTKAYKVGKEQKANVKMVAKALAMRGKAYKGLGETKKFEEDIEKAIKFLSTIAYVKFDKERWAECIEFSQRALDTGNEIGVVDADLLVLQGKANTKLKQVTEAENKKNLGNEAYKNKDFNTAMKHYLEATRLNPKEMTFLSNIAAVKLEQKRYEECVEFCTKAINIGRENRADTKRIEKAINRRDKAQKCLDDALKVKAKQQSQSSSKKASEDDQAQMSEPSMEEQIFHALQDLDLGDLGLKVENVRVRCASETTSGSGSLVLKRQ